MKAPESSNLYALDNAQLLNLVRRQRWYGLSQEMTDKARGILEQRGLDEGILRRLGYLKKDPFDLALRHYLGFKKHSRIAFLSYGVFIAFVAASFFLEPNWMISCFLLGLFAVLLGFVISSLREQLRFYQALGQPYADGSPLIFFFLGMPLYFLMYYRFRQQMEAHLERLV
jgi:hypothetical protein